MRIARATRDDLAPLVRLMAASMLLRRYGVTPASARASLGEALRRGDPIFVAVDRDSLVGLAWLITTRAIDRSAYLRLLLVADGARSRGTGTALLARTERAARAARCRHLALLVTRSNRRARTFYESHGYAHVGDLPGFVRARITEALYVKSLSPRASSSLPAAAFDGRPHRPRAVRS